MTVNYPDRYVIDALIARAPPLSANSPHPCRGACAVTDATRQMPLLPPIDRWGLISPITAQRGHRDRRQPHALRHGGTARAHRPPDTRELSAH